MGLLHHLAAVNEARGDSPPRKLRRVGSATPEDADLCTPSPRKVDSGALNQLQSPMIPERKAFRKPARARGISVLEAPRLDSQGRPLPMEAKPISNTTRGDAEDLPKRGYRRLQERKQPDKDLDVEAAFDRLAEGFAEDYWTSPACSRPQAAALLESLLAHSGQEKANAEEASKTCHHSMADLLLQHQDKWLRRLRMGFSLLLEGVGSKCGLLDCFADQVLRPSGADIARVDAFDVRASLQGFLREILTAQVPAGQCKGGTSVESLALAVRATREAMPQTAPPLAIVVLNLEAFPMSQLAALAMLASSPRIMLVASVDHMWAPLAWSTEVLKDFNFCREQVDTFEGYEVELKGKYPGNQPPSWCDPSADRQQESKVSIGLVLKSLTNNHRELCEVMAKNQLSGGAANGISGSDLLAIAEDRMIASNVTKLRSLLNELTDHEIVVQRASSDGGTLYWIPWKERALRKMANGESPDAIDGTEDAEENEDDEEDLEDEDGEESGAGED
mmetsp:Transcript_87156/g.154313  ORF Transcript_87156/g.154313 Transcript_87156/m.154313 type:complete len:505 (-) Transcript_87156:249-1763(-)|eukprot:CAMPEP_0197640034 /NCGR_PEP_ID=MMETSP1338-20131121/14463_1 /TAXON_ID=43686 ORGANISM="Pelagodinium beii, Strain RCC1491" /NCGR_SAMPLE_ID=MMETSP1338 /ASSEMBLY_ACC=CAM_ASM_000754 /LENGTH=504 /DNA_ID=CAMNT_0043212839 /DNA_START=30 /DNA_END=1544 /DNA_ORIENTATION=-